MGLLLLYRGTGVAPYLKSGYGVAGATNAGNSAAVFVERGFGKAGGKGAGVSEDTTPITSTPSRRYPSVSYQIAFASQPLSSSPAWVSMDTRLREIDSKRGRSYEFDRMETGTQGARLSNRDAALSPENDSSAYAPIKSTRPVRSFLQWETAYPLFRGISEGFPQTYISLGEDALVQVQANDNFYGLNNSRFAVGSTTLTVAMVAGTAGASETITVGTTVLPMPQAVPFNITIAGADSVSSEEVSVTAIVSATEYTVTRAQTTFAHSAGAAITTTVVSFGEALSGARIQEVLEAVGFDSSWYDLDVGQSLIAPSQDLASVAPLEHINLVTDAEFGRFFVSKAGEFTFRDRHSIILDYMSAVMTFRDNANTTANEVPYVLEGDLEHSEEKLYNRVRIIIQGGDYDGQIVDLSDSDSIDEHFERVFERTYPYANVNDADSAARFVLARNAEATLRIPTISVFGVRDPANLWPKLLAREIGDRVRFRYQPQGGGTEIDKQLSIEGISHRIRPAHHVVSFQCTEVDSNQYWILGMAGYSELDETTLVAF